MAGECGIWYRSSGVCHVYTRFLNLLTSFFLGIRHSMRENRESEISTEILRDLTDGLTRSPTMANQKLPFTWQQPNNREKWPMSEALDKGM
jgi:hypothetical protein